MKVEVLIMGDFNMSEINWNFHTVLTSKSRDIMEALNGVSLKQLVKSPNQGDNILDLAMTNGYQLSDVEVGENMSYGDHQCLLV